MTATSEMPGSEVLRYALLRLRKADLFTTPQLRAIVRVAQRNGYLAEAVAFDEVAKRRHRS